MREDAMSDQPLVTVVPDEAAFAQGAAAFIAARASQAIAERGRFSIVLTGGSTPAPIYRHLADEPWRRQIRWGQWDVCWGDERMVPPDDERSNMGLADRTLLAHVPIPPEHVQ